MRHSLVVWALIIGSLVWTSWATAAQIATVRVASLNLRSGPGKDHAVLGQLVQGTQVRIVARKNGWLKIDHQGTIGHIQEDPMLIVVSALPESIDKPKEAASPRQLGNQHPKAETIQKKVVASQNEVAAMNFREKETLDAFNAAERSLSQTRQRVRETQTALKGIQQKSDQINKQYADLERQISDSEAYAAQRLTALYKLTWMGRIHLLASADSFFDLITRKAALERILAQDEQIWHQLSVDRNELQGLKNEMTAAKAEKQSIELAQNQRADQLGVEQRQRSALLKQIQEEKALELVALKALQQAAKELDSAVATLKSSAPTVQADPKRPVAPGKTFDAYKGLLSWPVKGKIVSRFGPYRDEKYNVDNFQSGINIQAERGEPIRAVADGDAIFSSWFKGFGNMLIIDHGNHYYTVYAHLEEVFKAKGDRVDKNEVVATVGDSGSLMGPALHFEVRHHGKPTDPMLWIQKG